MFFNSSKSSLVSSLALAGSLMLIEVVSQPLPTAAQTLVFGSGDTVPATLYRAWFDCYGTPLSTSSKPSNCITSANFKFYYAAIASGADRGNFTFFTSTYGTPSAPPPFTDNQTASYPYPFNDFNSSVEPLNNYNKSNYSANAKTKGTGDPIQVPTSVSTINLAYNRGPSGQAQLPSTLNLSRKQYCDIWAGLIINWNQIVSNVNQPITLVVRSDSNSTTQDFFFHLDTICPTADPAISADYFVPNTTNGSGLQPLFPCCNFIGRVIYYASGNNGVTTDISLAPYSIGYISASFVSPFAQSGTPGRTLPSANLQNKSSSTYIAPNPIAAFNAVKTFVLTDSNGNSVIGDPDDYAVLKTFLVDPTASDAYPIVSTTFLDLYCKVPRSTTVGNSFKGFINAALANSSFPTGGTTYDKLATSLGLAPLGTRLKTSVRGTVGNINNNTGPCSL